MPTIESYELLLAAAAACEDKKAEDIRILALDPNESGLADYFLICNGTNDRQNVAITDEIEIRLKRDFGVYPNSVEGRRQGEWVLMDYVDFIVHVFSVEKRAFYGLERLRKTATTVSVGELSAELKAGVAALRAKSAKKVSGARSKAPSAAKKSSPRKKKVSATEPSPEVSPRAAKAKELAAGSSTETVAAPKRRAKKRDDAVEGGSPKR